MKTNKKSIESVKNLIEYSNLLDVVKSRMIERLDDDDIEDGALIFELDYCLELYETLTGQSPFLNGKEREDVEPIIKDYFRTTLIDFPYDIMTEDYILIYTKKY
jgi:hypothetical protein